MTQFPSGTRVYGRFYGGAVNVTAGQIVFSDIDGNEVTFLPGQRLIIYNVVVGNQATAKVLRIMQDHDEDAAFDSGEELVVFDFAAQATEIADFPAGLVLQKFSAGGDNILYVQASAAGAVDVTVIADLLIA